MKDYAGILKIIADENRLKILHMLSDGDMFACDILKELSVTQPTLSHHLKVLGDESVIVREKQGKSVLYSLNTDMLNDIGQYICGLCKSSRKEKSAETWDELVTFID